MTNVLVCVKRVPDVGGEVLLTADGQGVDARFVGFTTNAHESCAVELAVRVADGGEVAVLTLGPAEAVEQLRSALGVGCTAAVLVEADPAGFGPADVARLVSLRARFDREECPARDMLARYEAGDSVAGLRRP